MLAMCKALCQMLRRKKCHLLVGKVAKSHCKSTWTHEGVIFNNLSQGPTSRIPATQPALCFSSHFVTSAICNVSPRVHIKVICLVLARSGEKPNSSPA